MLRSVGGRSTAYSTLYGDRCNVGVDSTSLYMETGEMLEWTVHHCIWRLVQCWSGQYITVYGDW